jgi:ribonuclease J
MRDRKRLAEDGMVVVVMPVSSHDGALLSQPEIITRGFIYVKESGDLMKELQNVAMDAAEGVTRKRSRTTTGAQGRGEVRRQHYLFKTTKRNPMVIPVVTRL